MSTVFNGLAIPDQQISDTVKSTLTLVSAGTALKNPIQEDLDLLSGDITTAINTISTLESNGFLPVAGLDGTVSDLSSLTTLLESIESSIPAFQTHTDRISGVTITSSSSKPSITTIMTIGLSYIQLLQALSEETDGVYESLFGSITDGSTIFNQLTVIRNTNIETLLEAERNTGNPVAKYTEIEESFQSIETLLSDQIAADEAAFNTALTKLIHYSIALSIDRVFAENNTDLHSESYIQDFVATDSLLAIYQNSP